jgi:hypothetical protein
MTPKLFLLTLAIFISGLTTQGQTVVFNYDEFGNNTGNGSPQTSGTVGMDPNSGLTTLRYATSGNPVPGDVVILEPNSSGSDIIRFGGDGFMYFFSDTDDPGAPSLADGPFPQTLLANNLFFSESTVGGQTGLFNYSPGSGEPGQQSGFTTTYNFVSDGVIPEPSVLALITAGGLMILCRANIALQARRKGARFSRDRFT